jgi:hypothetical protein
MEQQFYCGAAKRCITPSDGLLPDLNGLMNQEFGGVLHELYLRVLVCQNRGERMLFVAFELDKAPQPERYLSELTAQFGFKEENIFLTAVHTHSAPISGYRPFEGPNNLERKPEKVQQATHVFEDFVDARLLEAVQEAITGLTPARMGFTTAKSYINVDRKQWYEYTDAEGNRKRKLSLGANHAAPVDRTVYVVKIEDLQGKALAIWVNYPVHCCVMHTNRCCNGKMGVSGDIAGLVSTWLEREVPGAVALWCSGAAGDINPIMQNELYYPDPENGAPLTKAMPSDNCSYLLELLAANHFDDIRRVLPKIPCSQTDVPLKGAVEWSRTPGVESEYEVRLHMMRVGELILLGGSGEFYSSYAACARNLLPAQDVILINHDASLCANSGYILDEETMLAPEVELPGTMHINMIPGNFEQSFVSYVTQMYAEVSKE